MEELDRSYFVGKPINLNSYEVRDIFGISIGGVVEQEESSLTGVHNCEHYDIDMESFNMAHPEDKFVAGRHCGAYCKHCLSSIDFRGEPIYYCDKVDGVKFEESNFRDSNERICQYGRFYAEEALI